VRPPFLNLRRLIVAGANLLEAEGRALRVSVVKLGLSLGGVVAGLVVLGGAAGLMVAALYFGLAPEIGRAWSLLACGVVCALAAVGITRLAVGLAR
jgi:hypothetical protein